ncbi:MAG: radical SAM protein, partial [Oscillospiraceae bacterium]|nr:radical SAM protein [Oscillospiraceae bacterium]
IPFCDGKCPYCSFYSKKGSDRQLDRYTDAVINAIAKYPQDFKAETIYFGGGTPSVMGAERLCRILAVAKARFGADQLETTVEVNPCTATEELLCALRQGGFDRVSFGVQSMDDRLLKILGRKHSAKQAKNAILLAHKAGFEHISADLMLALPEQTVSDIQNSIEQLAALPIDHLSAYILKVEQGTAFWGRYPDPDGDFAADCYGAMQQKCAELGFE